MRALALITAIATSAAAETPRAVDVERGTLWAPGADAPVAVASGCFLREDLCVSTGRELAELRAENAALAAELERRENAPTPGAVALLVALVAVLAGGGGYAASRIAAPR